MDALVFDHVSFAFNNAEGASSQSERAGEAHQREQVEAALKQAASDNPETAVAADEHPCVLSDVDWRIERGAFAVLTGNTGSGKSTLLRLCVPSLAPRGNLKGRVQVDGTVGYVAQNPDAQIVCDTVRRELAFGLENAGTPPDIMRRRIAEVATFLGIDSWMSRRCAELSGGQKQIVALAAALVCAPDVLLLDEPTAQLDPIAEQAFVDMLARVWRASGITVVVATHSPATFAHLKTTEYVLAGAKSDVCGLQDHTKLASMAFLTNLKLKNAEVRASESQIGFRHVHFAYNRDAAPVLQDCTLELAAGKIHALVGGNGSGKSTALKLLAGVLKPAHGRVLASVEARVAYLPQNVESLFVCDSVLEELMEWSGEGVFAARQLRRSSGASRANKRKRGGAQTAAYAQDEALELARAFGLETALDRHPFDLSGGEQRLLAIAKLLLLRPQLLLADEPTCGLDAPSRQAIAVVFKNMQVAGLTVVFATHDLNFAEGVASDISMIFDGQFSHPEPADEFFANNLFYKPAAVVDAATSAVDSRVASTLAVAATCTPASNIQVATN